MEQKDGAGMCKIAPFGMECEHEEYQELCISCLRHHLSQALSDMIQTIPILRDFAPEYHCPDFTIKKRGEKNE